MWLDDLASCTRTAQPTTAPTPAPTSALRECFETQTTTEYIFHEYDRQRENAIVVTPNTAPICFSGASSAHAVTIACNVVDAPTRVRVTPARIKLFASDLSRTASFALTPVPDATNDAIRVAFAVDCKVEETPSRGIITFRGNVLPVQQLSIEGFCVEHAARRCTSGNNGLITKSIASSGLNNVTLFAAMALAGQTFDVLTRIYINGSRCAILAIDVRGRYITFRTPSLDSVSLGFQAVLLVTNSTSETTAGALCWGEDCISDRCGSAEGSLCPQFPLSQRGIYFTEVCIGTNRMGSSYEQPFSPYCTSTNGNEAAERCSWGWGQQCRYCPIGCRCPGGPRCWVLKGFWKASVFDKTDPMPCKPALTATAKCVGFSLDTGTYHCGLNHAGYLCEGCEEGFYHHFGECKTCPSTELALAIVVPLIWNSVIAALLFTTLFVITFALLFFKTRCFSLTRSIQDAAAPKQSARDVSIESAWAAFHFTLFSIKTLQLVAISLMGARNPLPETLSTYITASRVVLLNLPEVHFDCIGKSGAYSGDIAVMALHAFFALVYVVLSLRYVGTAKCRRCGIAHVESVAEARRDSFAGDASTNSDAFANPVATSRASSGERPTMSSVDETPDTTSRARKAQMFLARKAHPYAMAGA